MKKSKIMALALAVAMILMGAGYAAWQDSVKLKSTVSTGKMNVEIGGCSKKLLKVEAYDTLEIYKEQQGIREPFREQSKLIKVNWPNRITNDNEGDQNDKLELESENVFPGAVVTIPGSIRNLSSIPVKIDNVQINCYVKGINEEDSEYELNTTLLDVFYIPELYYEILNDDVEYRPDNMTEIGINIPLAQLGDKIEDFLSDVMLKEHEEALIGSSNQNPDGGGLVQNMALEFKGGIEDIDYDFYENKTIKIEIKFTWKQFNE
ncbi:hypothetical protein [Oceanirhabdus seepicola]|uniref:Uncharacterized protein n=1 Tax=Oceanirhabdus seepicola TaxID=2828781 RepID=A0A9J6P0R2_9CLOT|nr:hypothetical protein [Oceanirhabdus seepicola]MCM1990231.1 hypothetical protein [Oceanirhabdus seepicola]